MGELALVLRVEERQQHRYHLAIFDFFASRLVNGNTAIFQLAVRGLSQGRIGKIDLLNSLDEDFSLPRIQPSPVDSYILHSLI